MRKTAVLRDLPRMPFRSAILEELQRAFFGIRLYKVWIHPQKKLSTFGSIWDFYDKLSSPNEVDRVVFPRLAQMFDVV